jgi:phosphoglycolate phosphatase-like HAD superfamily hydrolase
MKFVIFDIDGTLANTKTVDDQCFIKSFMDTFEIDITNEKWEELQNVTDWGMTEEILIREVKRNPTNDDYRRMKTNMLSNLANEKIRDQSQFNEVLGARNFFYELKEKKEFELGIATGAWEQSAKFKLDSIGIELNSICFSNSDHHKRREDITRDVINQLKNRTNTSPDQIIYFGDGAWDYKTCKNLGIDFIGIDIKGSGDLGRIGAKTVFRDFSDNVSIMRLLSK